MELRAIIFCRIFTGAALILAMLGQGASAAEPLAWKFEKGASNRYRMNQSMTMKMDMNENKVESKVDQIIDMTWKVLEVKENGSAILDQKIERMRMTIDAGETK